MIFCFEADGSGSTTRRSPCLGEGCKTGRPSPKGRFLEGNCTLLQTSCRSGFRLCRRPDFVRRWNAFRFEGDALNEGSSMRRLSDSRFFNRGDALGAITNEDSIHDYRSVELDCNESSGTVSTSANSGPLTMACTACSSRRPWCHSDS